MTSIFFVFFVFALPGKQHTFTFGLNSRVRVQTSFLSSLSFEIHFHFWFGFIQVPDMGAGLPGSGTRDWLLISFSILGISCRHSAFELHMRESPA